MKMLAIELIEPVDEVGPMQACDVLCDKRVLQKVKGKFIEQQ